METLINICRWLIKSVRGILVAALVVCLGIPATLYVMLSTDWAQEHLRTNGEIILEKLLGVDVEIGQVKLRPFSRLSIRDIAVHDDYGREALKISSVEGRIELTDFLLQRGLIIDYATINGLDAKIYRLSPDSPLNIDGIIRNLTTDKPKTEKKDFMLRLNTAEIRNSAVSYDVYGDSLKPELFDPSHIALSEVNAVVHAPIVSTDAYGIRLRRLQFVERSGFRVDNISGNFKLSSDSILVTDLTVDLPHSSLQFSDLYAHIDSIQALGGVGTIYPATIGIMQGSHLSLSDFSAFDHRLADLDADVNLSLRAHGILDSLCIDTITMFDNIVGLDLSSSGCAKGLSHPAEAVLSGFEVNVEANGPRLLNALGQARIRLKPNVQTLLKNAGIVQAVAYLDGGMKNADFTFDVYSDVLTANGSGTAGFDNFNLRFDGDIDIADGRLDLLTGKDALGELTARISSNLQLRTGKKKGLNLPQGDVDLQVDRFQFKGHEYSDIQLKADISEQMALLSLASLDPAAHFGVFAEAERQEDSDLIQASVHGNIYNFSPSALGLGSMLGGKSLQLQFEAEGEGTGLDKFKAQFEMDDIAFTDTAGVKFRLGDLSLCADNLSPGQNAIELYSDYANLTLQGKYNLATLPAAIKETMVDILPFLAPRTDESLADVIEEFKPSIPLDDNEFDYVLTIDDAHPLSDFFKLPIYFDDPVEITGDYSQKANTFSLNVDAPVFLNGNKVVRNTVLHAQADGNTHRVGTYLTMVHPTKKGDMQLDAYVDGINGIFSTKVDWEIIRDKAINGQFNFNTSFSRPEEDGPLAVRVGLRHGTINFGDAVWTIMPDQSGLSAEDRSQSSSSLVAGKMEAVIEYWNNTLKVSDFMMQSPGQYIKIDGTASASEDDHLVVDMHNIQMINIFETLEIDKAMICGSATGTIDVSALFSKTPVIKSTQFNVKDIGYNDCILGDADIELGYNLERQSFDFLAHILSAENRESIIDGWIRPADEGISLKFTADRVKVGFMKPYVSAFCDDIEGYASGDAELYGTFKYINMRGRLYAQDLRMKIGYTNTWYSATDSVILDPGIIHLDNILLRDGRGGTATLNGQVTHSYFKRAGFDFDIRVNSSKPMLCYDVPQQPDDPDQRWYGEIYCQKGSRILVHGIPGDTQKPGHVDISIYANTGENSVFTFELSDQQVAQDYTFLTFRDVTPQKHVDQYLESSLISKSEIWAAQHQDSDEDDLPTEYTIDITANVQPNAKAIIVMDPIGRDAIEAYGSGLLNLTYNSSDESLSMRGTYTLTRGNYLFTLQDLIFKHFSIQSGSKITFDGDPYECLLDITANYNLKANLSDLDESFLYDKDLERTNVDVAALLLVTGRINDLQIKFDLAFPHLTNDDVYRKVRSIISTEEMMSRQIVYLMTLNRFYTPEYMSTTKGNELFSVASSTISAQLSNALGKLANNWTITPNVRSDRGDFSDLEVDLQLSSALLDNKLLFNGNFGYRDKSLNTNQFVGDFDIEYLLNPSGTLRLRAYNRYNDQNYYLRSAQTTQGVGIVIKHDFDNMFQFLRRKKQTTLGAAHLFPDSIMHAVPKDTIKPAVPKDTIMPAANRDSLPQAVPDSLLQSQPQK